MYDFESALEFHRNETRGWGWSEAETTVYCCNCEAEIHPDDVGEYVLVETGEPVCGAC